MDKDTPRYGTRDEDESQRRTNEPQFDEDRNERRGFTSSRYNDDDEWSAPPRKSAGSYARPDPEPDSTFRRRLGSLEGLRSSNYDPDEPPVPDHDSTASPASQDNGGYSPGSDFDSERSSFRSRLSSFDEPDRATRNPLLRSDPSERRFSWEQDTPTTRPRLLPERDYDTSRHSSGRSRLDELTARHAERTTRRTYGSEDPDDTGFGRASGYEDRPTSRPLESRLRHPLRDDTYRRELPPRDDYLGAEQAPDFERAPFEQASYEPAPYEQVPHEQPPREPDPYESAAYQGAHARELADVDERYAREHQYGGEGEELRQDYGDFDQDFPQFDQPYNEQPEKKRRGPFLLLGSLLGVAVIAGGLIFVYQQGLREGQSEAIPVVTADEAPVKVVPSEPGGVNISRKTKLIYDRIIGEETQSNDTLVPREEVPLPPSDQNQSNSIPAPDTDAATVAPSAVTEQTDTDVTGSEPLPLPLPPPPAPLQVAEPTPVEVENPTATLGTGGQIVAPSGLETTSEPPSPASEQVVAVAEPVQPPETTPQTQQPDALGQLITSPPLPKDKPTPPSLQAEPGPAVPTGPIQIAPLPGSVARETTTTNQTVTDQATPTQVQPSTESTTPRRVVSSRFGEELTSGVTSSFTQQNTQIAAIEPQVQTQSPAPAVPEEQAPITGGRYLIQLAAFRSQEEAQAEFESLRGRHPSLLNSYSSLIQQADLGTRGVYYRLRIGPIETKSNASELCNSLIAAGERDCLVRQR